MNNDSLLTVVGRVEKVNLPTLGLNKVPAKVDTGADSSAIWCSKLKLVDNSLECVFFGKKSPFYTGKKVVFKNEDVDLTRVTSSFGHKELRYKVKIPVSIK